MDRHIFSELVSAIYDAALDQSLWPSTLGLICNTFGFRKGTIDLNRLADMTNLFNFHYGIDASQSIRMMSHYRLMPEVWGGLGAIMTRPIDRPWVVSRIMTQDVLRSTEYYRGWVGPMELIDGAAIVLARGHGLFGSMRLATDARLGLIDDDLADALALLLPHCQRAARINGMLEGAQAATRDFRAVIDALRTPVVLVSAECAVVHANGRATALFQDDKVLRCRRGRLTSSSVSVSHAIENTITRLARDETDIPEGSGSIALRTDSEELRFLHILPLSAGEARTRLAGGAVAAIFVSDDDVDSVLPHDILTSMFGMTAAEIHILELIMAGCGTRMISARLDIAPSTVRTHVLHLLEKTETHSRADLVKLANRMARPIVSV